MRIVASAALLLACSPLSAAKRVDFVSEIRPILSDKCYTCHGPDEAKRLGPVRFDVEEDAKKDLGGRVAIAPGEPEKSTLVARIKATDATKMPPAHSGKSLTEAEVALLTEWVEQGAEWSGHWSFQPPKRGATPGGVHAIDHFVRRRLEDEGLAPAARAPKETLIRRASFDITGLPPTVEEVDAFLADDSPDAYERVLDRLFASPRYGERMAIRWLDAARYADTNGYQTDAERYMWRWRDWVIEAFNSNMPFDQFTIEQLAGDLLPNATTDQIVATGFNRNHRANSEGGIVAEEYLVEYAVDRVATTSTVWMGLTLGCARCHDHKYDPFTQKEFYQLIAYFNNIPERGKVFKYGNTPPFIAAPTPEQKVELTAYERDLQAARERFEAAEQRHGREREQWSPEDDHWSPGRRLLAREGFDREEQTGPVGRSAAFDGTREVVVPDGPHYGYEEAYTMAAWVKAEGPDGAIVAQSSQDKNDRGYGFTGWGLYLIDGKIKSYSINRLLDDGVRVSTKDDLPVGEWHHVAVTVDGSRLAKGMRIFVDGEEWETVADLDSANQEIRRKKEPVLIGMGGGLDHGFKGMIDEVRLYDGVLSDERIAVLATRESLKEIAATPASQRSRAQADKLRLAFSEQYGPKPLREAWSELLDSRRALEEFRASLPTVMVMQERPEVRDTFLLARGAYDAPTDQVMRAVPAKLPPFPDSASNDRLGLAKWLVSDDHPLTARVMVNRLWQMYFGRGIVATVEDFGSQGEPPTHPELLDWLARELIESGWDVKHIAKTILMSETYRQLSRADEAAIERDPENKLLARGPRMRLPAEMVRDQALAIAGLLVDKVGGPSVKPYQPDGLWKELSGQSYEHGEGDDLYRRSLYTYWKRSAPPPFMMNFDSAGREACTVTHTRTNTPLQALNLMNDVTYVEAARVFAEQMIEQGETAGERLEYAFRAATSRQPSSQEVAVLVDSVDHYLERYRESPRDARALLGEGEAERDSSINDAELAAYTAVASLILNLDETITKE